MDDTLGRIAKHLPMVGPNGTLGRFSLDSGIWKWTTDDVTLIVLKGHLLVEAELVEICSRCLKKPDALGNVRFAVRLNLLRAVLGDDDVPEAIWLAITDLNQLRNNLAHNLEPNETEARLACFIERFAAWDIVDPHGEEMPRRLIGCLAILLGALSRIGKQD